MYLFNSFMFPDSQQIRFQSFQICPQNIIPNVAEFVETHFDGESQEVHKVTANDQAQDHHIITTKPNDYQNQHDCVLQNDDTFNK